MKTVQTMEPMQTMQRVQTEWKWMYHGLEPDLDLQSLLHHCIVIPISFRCHSDIISMSFRCHSGVVPLSFQCHFIARDMTKFWQWNDPETKSSLDLGSFYFRTTGNEKRPRSRERQERSWNDPQCLGKEDRPVTKEGRTIQDLQPFLFRSCRSDPVPHSRVVPNHSRTK